MQRPRASIAQPLLIDNLIHLPIGPPSQTPARDLLTPDEVAELLRVSKTSVYRLVERRAIRFYRVCGLLRFAREDVHAYLGAGRVEPMGT
jgi:excisionase family DNA binding protein